VRAGASPRGLQALVVCAQVRALLEGRFNVSVGDIQALARPALRHRILLNFDGQAEGLSSEVIIDRVLEAVPIQ
jgi:MoxR-like ATPase